MTVLKSKDEADLLNNSWMFDGDCKFLDGKDSLDGNKIYFTSFPRSGNSFLRRLLEEVTGIATGSNWPQKTGWSL